MNQAVKTLIGLHIIGQHGREIGVVSDMSVDVENWRLQSLMVKLNREALENLKLKRPWFGSQTVQIPVIEISGATDNCVLKSPLEEIEFTGGEPSVTAPPVPHETPDTVLARQHRPI